MFRNKGKQKKKLLVVPCIYILENSKSKYKVQEKLKNISDLLQRERIPVDTTDDKLTNILVALNA